MWKWRSSSLHKPSLYFFRTLPQLLWFSAYLHSAAGPAATPGAWDRNRKGFHHLLQCKCENSLRCPGNRDGMLERKETPSCSNQLSLKANEVIKISFCAKICTKLLRVHLFHSMDGCQVHYASLNACASVSGHFVHPFNHLLLSVYPIQMIPEDWQSYWLKNVGIL